MSRMKQPSKSGTAAEVSQHDAIEIAARKVGARPEEMSVIYQNAEPARFGIYNVSDEPCWWVVAPHADSHGVLALRSSRIVLVGRQSGAVLFDGLANDEG